MRRTVRRQTFVKMDASTFGKIRKTKRLLAEKAAKTFILGYSWEHWCQRRARRDKDLRQLCNICREQTKLYKKFGSLFSSKARIKQYDIEATLEKKLSPSSAHNRDRRCNFRTHMLASVILEWRKYELYNYTTRLAYILIWNLYVYLVSFNTYEQMQLYFFRSYYFLYPTIWTRLCIFKKVEIDLKHLSPDATHLSHKIDEHLKVSHNTPHFTAAIIALILCYKIGCAELLITLRGSTTTLKVFHCIDWALPYTTTASAK